MKLIDKEDTKTVINLLKQNNLVIIKTDTVYGIMALANRENELRINQFKERIENKKVSIIFPDVDTLLKNIVGLNMESINLINAKLPGKYTFVVNLDNYKDFDRSDFGVRVTSYEYLQNIIKYTGPLLASSCNKAGFSPCIDIDEINNQFKDTDISVVYDGPGSSTPSTIIDIRDNNIKILR